MKVLVIGARGMLGQELVRAFGPGHEVIAADRGEVDIADESRIMDHVSRLKPDLVINSAAYNNVDAAENETEQANLINGLAVGYLAKLCKELRIPLIHYSTEYVFDGGKEGGYKEDDIPAPLSAYGKSKHLGEQELQKNTDQYYLIRLSRLFGRAAATMGAKKSFVEMMLGLAEKRDELEVVDEELSSPTYAEDLAKRTRYIVENNLPYGIYHCANEGAVTWYGFAAEIFKIAGKNVKLIPVPASRFPRPAARPKFGILLNSTLPTMRDWKEALREFLELRSKGR